MPKKKLTALDKLDTRELSIVDAGANLKKRFPITKQENNMDKEFEEILKAVLETEADDEGALDEYIKKMSLSDKGVAALRSALRILAAYRDELPKGALDQLAAAAGMDKPMAKAKEGDDTMADNIYPKADDEKAVKKFVDDMPEEIRKALGLVEEQDDKDDKDDKPELGPEVEAILKAKDEQIDALKGATEKLEKAQKDAEDRRVLAEYVAKAKADLAHVPGKSADEMGAELKALHDVDPKMAESHFATLKATSETIAKSELLATSGAVSTGDAKPGSAWEEIQKKADGFVEKSAGDMSREKAVARVLDLYPELYTRYLDENPHQVAASLRS